MKVIIPGLLNLKENLLGHLMIKSEDADEQHRQPGVVVISCLQFAEKVLSNVFL